MSPRIMTLFMISRYLSNYRKHLLITLGVICLFTIFGVILLLLIDRFHINPPHPSDEEMVANFSNHRTEFELLRQMIIRDKGLRGVDNKRVLLNVESKGIPQKRIEEYRALFRKLGLQGGVGASSDRTHISFISFFSGWVTHNSEKGYLYTEKAPESTRLVNNLDSFKAHESRSGLRQIENNWYLYYEGY